MAKKNNRRGRPRPHYRGNPLWQILENLPDNGVGRLIVRGSFQQKEDEPSYMRILNVDMASKGPHRKKKNKIQIAVEVERVWRGVIFPRSVNICSTSHLADFKLVPKEEEEKYLKHTKTASEVGYHYWTAGQKKRIKALIAQGLTPLEAKQKELERIALEQAEAAERAGVEPSREPVPKIDQSNFTDNFDDVEDEGETEDSFDADYIPEEKKQVAFEAAAANAFNESDAGPSTGSKRSSSLTTNAPSTKLTKIG